MHATHSLMSCMRHIRSCHACDTFAHVMHATHSLMSCIRHIRSCHAYGTFAHVMHTCSTTAHMYKSRLQGNRQTYLELFKGFFGVQLLTNIQMMGICGWLPPGTGRRVRSNKGVPVRFERLVVGFRSDILDQIRLLCWCSSFQVC